MLNRQVVIVLPTYNEKENLPRMVQALLELAIPHLSILIVDDNSPDGTGQIADELARAHDGKIHVLHRAGKGGLGKAYVAGFSYVLEQLNADYIIQMDCDFSHQPQYVPQLVAKADEGYQLVIGSRYYKGGSVDKTWSFYRKLLSWFANRVYVPLLLQLPITDATGGFKLWQRDTLYGMNLARIESNGYIFQTEMSYVAYRLGYKIAEIPIYFPDRVEGQSKMGIRIQIEAALRVFEVRSRHHKLTQQMRRQ
ncbi:MAG: polyprenol monophosphomannose synthase [Phototrophicaceae bacterium]